MVGMCLNALIHLDYWFVVFRKSYILGLNITLLFVILGGVC